jgi:putative spermidine/putrescine transport system permease protein
MGMMAATTPRTLSTRQFYWLLVLPAVLMMAGFYVYPLVKVLWISVTEPQLGLQNYERLFTSESVQRVLWVTARISLITSAITLVLGYVVAYAMVHSSEGQLRWLTFFVLLPLWISVLVRAFAWVTLLRSNGIINSGLMHLGVISEPIPLLRNELGVMIGMVHYMIPFAVLPLYANMRGIDLRLVAAARGLGANAWQAFGRVFLPLSMPGIVGAGVLVFIFSLGFYVTPAILGGGRVLLVSEYIGVQILNTIRWGLATMLASTLLICVLLLLAALSRIVDLRKLFGAR